MNAMICVFIYRFNCLTNIVEYILHFLITLSKYGHLYDLRIVLHALYIILNGRF